MVTDITTTSWSPDQLGVCAAEHQVTLTFQLVSPVLHYFLLTDERARTLVDFLHTPVVPLDSNTSVLVPEVG